jgi:ribosomal protein S18 acetylase RimI-like enzyme
MLEVIIADMKRHDHSETVVQLMDAFAIEFLDNGNGLSDEVKKNLVKEMSKRNTVHVIIALVNKRPAGIAILQESFSTFSCKNVLNVHDIYVSTEYRGIGLSKMLLKKAEEIADNLMCSKMTIEVLEGNFRARSAYQSFGFSDGDLNPKMGKVLLWEKKCSRN